MRIENYERLEKVICQEIKTISIQSSRFLVFHISYPAWEEVSNNNRAESPLNGECSESNYILYTDNNVHLFRGWRYNIFFIPLAPKCVAIFGPWGAIIAEKVWFRSTYLDPRVRDQWDKKGGKKRNKQKESLIFVIKKCGKTHEKARHREGERLRFLVILVLAHFARLPITNSTHVRHFFSPLRQKKRKPDEESRMEEEKSSTRKVCEIFS